MLMEEDLFVLVKDMLSKKYSPDEVKSELLKKGLLESDAEKILYKAIAQYKDNRARSKKKLLRQLSCKEVLDRTGYGFVSHPILNILFMFSGASYFLIGVINGLRMIFSLLYSSFLKEYGRFNQIGKRFIGSAGIIYGFAFLFMSLAVVIKSPLIFLIFFLLAGIAIVAHGELYTNFLRANIQREHFSKALLWLSRYGILITIVSMLISGYIMDLFPVAGRNVVFDLFGKTFDIKVYGYLISFEITAFAFIFSGMIMSYVRSRKPKKEQSMLSFFKQFSVAAKVHSADFFRNKVFLLLALTSLITGLVQVLGNSFYGIFIYDHFESQFLGGFLNVAVVFSFAALASLIGPWFTRALHRHIGISPMLVFGTLLTAMLPLSLAFNPNFVAIILAAAFSVIGASILGMAQGFFTRRLLDESQRNIYFSFIGVVITLPLLLLIPFGSALAQVDLSLLFKIIVGLLVLVVAPIYFSIVMIYERRSAAHRN